MANEVNDLLKFVDIIEEHQDVLTKSQTKEQKQRKAEAAEQVISKWKVFSGKTLTEQCLFKKINNTKSRAKLTQNSGKPLSEWQSKILRITGADNDNDEKLDKGSGSVPSPSCSVDPAMKTAAEELLDKFETDDTKLLSDKQLQRLVLLKQVKLLSMQQQYLEGLGSRATGLADATQNIVFDFVDWNDMKTNQ